MEEQADVVKHTLNIQELNVTSQAEWLSYLNKNQYNNLSIGTTN